MMSFTLENFGKSFRAALFLVLGAGAVTGAPRLSHAGNPYIPRNFAMVEKVGQIYRGGVPSNKQLLFLKESGMKTILSLQDSRFAGEGGDIRRVKKIATGLGMTFVNLPIFPISHPANGKINKAVAFISDPNNWPIYVHCKLGDDRTGYVIGAYRAAVNRVKGRLAYKEMRKYGFKLFWWQDDFRRYAKKFGVGW